MHVCTHAFESARREHAENLPRRNAGDTGGARCGAHRKMTSMANYGSDGERAVPCRFLGGRARVVTCGSFSKTVAPGHRIGWVISDEFADEIARLKRSFSCASGMLSQLVLADFLASGDYQRHLKALQAVLSQNAERMRALVEESFPEGTRVSRPHGGSVLWVELRPRDRRRRALRSRYRGGNQRGARRDLLAWNKSLQLSSPELRSPLER